MANSKPNKEYARFRRKTYSFALETPGRAEADRMKRGILARCEENNGFTAGKISASHKGRVSGEITYRLESGAATPTHIKRLLVAVGNRRNVELDIEEIIVEFVDGSEPTTS